MSKEETGTSSELVQSKEDSSGKEIATTEVESTSSVVDPELIIKHPLQNRWVLWYYKNDRAKTWEQNLQSVIKFDTIEDFWRVYNFVQPASKLGNGCDYNLFKDGIDPKWEDAANKHGGKWLLTLPKQQRNTELDKIWMETLLCLIGEGFGDDSDFVNGGVVQIRQKGDKAAIWTSDFKKESSMRKIGRIYKERLALPKNMKIAFQTHHDAMTKSSSTVKSKYTV